MILTRFVRIQLVIFTVLSIVGGLVMAFGYIQVQNLLGVGKMTVALELPAAGGLYRFGNVTYRGVEVGKVLDVELTPDGVRAILSIDDGQKIPADLDAEVRSVSAVGEQYVDLRPRTDSPPYLQDGSVIESRDATIPQPVGPMLDSLSALVGTIPKDELNQLLDEVSTGLDGADYDLQSLLDSTSTVAAAANGVADSTRSLIEDAEPLLDSQVRSADAIAIWTRSLAGVTGQLNTNDPQIRSILQSGPGFAETTTALLDSVKLTLPVLLANLTSVGQLGVTYNAGLEQMLVLLPPAVSMIQTVQPKNNAAGLGLGTFRFGGISDPPACTVGFLPPSEWRSPQDTETLDTPEDLYCKLPQDSQVAVRGARNIPCMNNPAKRAATAELCNSDQEFVPVATEQPVIGPYPRDPNLESQGIAPDSRYEGVPPPSGILDEASGQQATNGGVQVTPSSYGTTQIAPAVTAAPYDPQTGRYVGPDGQMYQKTDLVAPAAEIGWQEMIPH
ncbi:MCE family protein [Rhodococcus gannanensis]|uniref:MCE family protein n=1 Tax=Rhodococcus gannanensis TaxID=1960308 RepID=A0ABW4NY33_9NOCA